MNDIFIPLKEGICQLFSDAEDMELTLDTKLEEIPDWDSMAAVNLQSYLEQEFKIAISLDMLDGETSLGELVSRIENLQSVAVRA
ncbi:MAG: acyl carrier protein [Desulfobacterales bacterium]|jgi:acyl carrier protein